MFNVIFSGFNTFSVFPIYSRLYLKYRKRKFFFTFWYNDHIRESRVDYRSATKLIVPCDTGDVLAQVFLDSGSADAAPRDLKVRLLDHARHQKSVAIDHISLHFIVFH